MLLQVAKKFFNSCITQSIVYIYHICWWTLRLLVYLARNIFNLHFLVYIGIVFLLFLCLVFFSPQGLQDFNFLTSYWTPCTHQWKCGVLITGLPGNILSIRFFRHNSIEHIIQYNFYMHCNIILICWEPKHSHSSLWQYSLYYNSLKQIKVYCDPLFDLVTTPFGVHRGCLV